MKKIIIVEDEKLIRQGIEVMLKNTGIPYKSILAFKNGLEAWEYIQENSDIDLVITDVKMPKMDGIKLVKKINKLKSRPYILVVSGYSDFEYVVEMLRYGTVDYLLKPLNRNEFEKRLIEIHEMLYQKQTFDIRIQKILENDLNDTLLNKDSKKPSLSSFIYSHLKLRQDTSYQIVCINRYNTHSDDFYLGNVNGNHFMIKFRDFNKTSSVYSSALMMDDALEEAYYSRAKEFFNALEIRAENLEVMEESNLFNLLQNVFVNKMTSLSENIIEIVKKVESGILHPESLIKTNNIIFNLLHQYYGYLDYQNVIGKFPKELFYYDTINEYIEEIVAWEKYIIENFELNTLKDKSNINEALNFINKNFEKDINMATVSNYISMNYSVFSQLFKEHVGVNFIDYLKKLRIDKSKKYLVDTDLFIKEISEKVGYIDYKYFTKLFKNEVGVSPSEYRKMKGN